MYIKYDVHMSTYGYLPLFCYLFIFYIFGVCCGEEPWFILLFLFHLERKTTGLWLEYLFYVMF